MGDRELRPNSEMDSIHWSKWKAFRIAADYVASAFAELPAVRRVALFGSVFAGKKRCVPKRGHRFHGPNDVDLAVWVDDASDLSMMRIARSRAVRKLFAENEIGVAHHQVDVFILGQKGKLPWPLVLLKLLSERQARMYGERVRQGSFPATA